MLINFTLENFRSINERITLDMQAMGQVSELKVNVIDAPRQKLLKSAVIYGANGSGKSNIIKGLNFFTHFVKTSIDSQEGDPIPNVIPFLLGPKELGKRPSSFEMEFLIDGSKFRYGFEATSEKIYGEWLFRLPKGGRKERNLFLREEQTIEVSKKNFREGLDLEGKTRNNSLFLSVCAQFNGEIAKSLLLFFNRLNGISGVEDRRLRNFTTQYIKDADSYTMVLKLLDQADIGIEGIVEEKPFEKELPPGLPEDIPEDFKEDLRKTSILYTERKAYDSKGREFGVRRMPFDEAESAGTKKYFHLLGPIRDTLHRGGILVVDELDARLHPKLTLNIIRMFHDPEINRRGAQLIFATHDTNLLASGLFRRDQIFFTEKNRSAATDLYSLAEFKLESGASVRKDANFEINYLKGRYGAIPFMGSLDLFKIFQSIERED
ncbi:MAG: ATP-binding protein [Lentisphaeria bacterium]|nr:ATP-binding protein [Lentisphaeria bacterium]